MVDTFAPDGNSPMKVAPEMVEAVSRLKSSAASISGLGWEATPYTPLGLPVLKLIAVAQAGTAHKDRIVRPKPATLRIILGTPLRRFRCPPRVLLRSNIQDTPNCWPSSSLNVITRKPPRDP